MKLLVTIIAATQLQKLLSILRYQTSLFVHWKIIRNDIFRYVIYSPSSLRCSRFPGCSDPYHTPKSIFLAVTCLSVCSVSLQQPHMERNYSSFCIYFQFAECVCTDHLTWVDLGYICLWRFETFPICLWSTDACCV